MSHIIQAFSNTQLSYEVSTRLQNEGKIVDTSNATINSDPTTVLRRVVCEVTNPRNRWVQLQHRNHSAIAACGETLWVLSGRNDIKWLSKFLSRAINFSDDGVTWRGAYGERMYICDQIQGVIDRLSDNLNTRQAYLTLYNPNLDSNLALTEKFGEPSTKDFICNFGMVFEVEDGKLNLTVTNRSSDIVHGLCSINVIEFTIIQELISSIIGVELGSFYFFSTNMHYYHNALSKRHVSIMSNQDNQFVSNNSSMLSSGTLSSNTMKSFFYEVTTIIEHKDLESLYDIFQVYKIPTNSLLFQMAYISYCKINNELIDLSIVKDGGLKNSILLSKVDRKHIKITSMEDTRLDGFNNKSVCMECGDVISHSEYDSHMSISHEGVELLSYVNSTCIDSRIKYTLDKLYREVSEFKLPNNKCELYITNLKCDDNTYKIGVSSISYPNMDNNAKGKEYSDTPFKVYELSYEEAASVEAYAIDLLYTTDNGHFPVGMLDTITEFVEMQISY